MWNCFALVKIYIQFLLQYNTVEHQWLEHLLYYENMFETGVVQANESYLLSGQEA